jgi:hypothetical protein
VEYACASPRAKLSVMEWDGTYDELEWSLAGRDAAKVDAGEHRRAGEDDHDGAQVIRLRPLRVLVVSADEPFRAASAMLIARRDCVVFRLNDRGGAADLVARERIDVVLVDGPEQSRALAEELAGAVPPVGIVAVGEAQDGGLAGGPTLARWAPFEELFEALVRADRRRLRGGASEAGRLADGRSHLSG